MPQKCPSEGLGQHSPPNSCPLPPHPRQWRGNSPYFLAAPAGELSSFCSLGKTHWQNSGAIPWLVLEMGYGQCAWNCLPQRHREDVMQPHNLPLDVANKDGNQVSLESRWPLEPDCLGWNSSATLWCWVSSLASVSLSFLLCTMGTTPGPQSWSECWLE